MWTRDIAVGTGVALDFLALHPRTLSGPARVAGVGSGIIYGIGEIARRLAIPRIWGEATANSAPFYEKLIELAPVRDLFIIESREMAAIRNRQLKVAEKVVGQTLPRKGGMR